MVKLMPADISGSAGAQTILDAIRMRWPWVKHLFADGAYDDGTQLMDKAAFLDIVRRIDKEPSFKGAAAALGSRAYLQLAHPMAPVGLRLLGRVLMNDG